LKKQLFKTSKLLGIFLIIGAICTIFSAITINANSIILQQNFDSSTSIPTGWTRTATSSSSWIIASFPGSSGPLPYSYSNYAKFYGQVNASSRLYTTSGINNTGGQDLIFSFYMYHDSGYMNNDNIQPQYSIDGVNWNNIGTPISRYFETSGWMQHSVIMSGVVSNNIKIALNGTSQGGGYIYIDDIEVTAVSGAIADLKQTAATQNGITLSFSKPTNATSVTLQVSQDGTNWTPCTTSEVLGANSTSAIATGLQMDTIYVFRLDVTGGAREGSSNVAQASTDSIGAPSADFTFDTSTGTITKYIGQSSNVIIPEKIFGVGVTSIGDGSFQSCHNLSNVIIPIRVTKIGNAAFRYCDSLNSIDIPNSITIIGNSSFASCSGLSSITIPNSVTSIGGYAFSECSNLKNISMPNSITIIDDNTFSHCHKLYSITIPSSIIEIRNSAFADCTNLNDVIFDGNAPSGVDWATFSNDAKNLKLFYRQGKTGFTTPMWNGYICEMIGAITNLYQISSTQNSVTLSFAKPIGATSVILQISTDNINWEAATVSEAIDSNSNFVDAVGLQIDTSYMFRIAVTGGDRAGISNITQAYSDSPGSPSADFIFDTITGTISNYKGTSSNVEIPYRIYGISVKNIKDNAFSGRTNISSIIIPNCVTSIGNSAFVNCTSLSSITLPNGITSIGNTVFYGCTNLSAVFFEGNAPSIMGSNVFLSVKSGFKIYCKMNATGFTTPTWKGYACEILSEPYFSSSITQNNVSIQNTLMTGSILGAITNNTRATNLSDILIVIYSRNNKVVKIVKQSVILNSGVNTISFSDINIPNAIESSYNIKLFTMDTITNIKPLAQPSLGIIQ